MTPVPMVPHPFPVFRSTLLAEALTKYVLSQYDLGDHVRCHLFWRGINDTYRVDSSRGRWMLRVTTTIGQTPQAVKGEVDLLLHLQQSGVDIAPPVATRAGRYVTVLDAPEGERPAVLFEFVPKANLREVSPEHARRYGAALAAMHRAADSFTSVSARPAHDYDYFVDEPLRRLGAFEPFAAQTAQLAYLQESALAAWEQASRLPKRLPYFGLCHGDAKSDNALYGDDGSLTLIDFEFSGMGWRVYDLATYIWVHIINSPELDWSKKDHFRALLAGYQSVRSLTTAELQALPSFAALRQFFLFGEIIRNTPAWGHYSWCQPGWLDRMTEFIRCCRDGQWLERVGLA